MLIALPQKKLTLRLVLKVTLLISPLAGKALRSSNASAVLAKRVT